MRLAASPRSAYQRAVSASQRFQGVGRKPSSSLARPGSTKDTQEPESGESWAAPGVHSNL